jgi:hypothetical protein
VTVVEVSEHAALHELPEYNITLAISSLLVLIYLSCL